MAVQPNRHGCPRGCYVAFEGLTGKQWYGRPYFRSYWASAMHVALRNPPLPRGYAMYQYTQETICGVPADPNLIGWDHRGDRPYFAAA